MQNLDEYKLEDYLYHLCLSPCGEYLLGASGRNSIHVLRLSNEVECVSEFDTFYNSAFGIAVHPQQRWIVATGDRDYNSVTHSRLCFYEWPSGNIIKEVLLEGWAIQTLAFSPDGQWLVAGTDTGLFELISLDDFKVKYQFPGGEKNMSVAFHPQDGTIMTSRSSQGYTHLKFCKVGEHMLPPPLSNDDYWKLSNFYPYFPSPLEIQSNHISAAVFSPCGEYIGVSHWHPALYSYSDRRLLRTFDPEGTVAELPIPSWVDIKRYWTKPVFTSGSGTLICGSPDGEICQWNVKSGQLLHKVVAHAGRVFDIALSPDGKTLLSSGADRLLKLWRVDINK